MFYWKIIQTGFHKDGHSKRFYWNTTFDWKLIQSGIHKDGRLGEILNTVFDWEVIQTGFHEDGRLQEILIQCLTKNWFKWDLKMVAYKKF